MAKIDPVEYLQNYCNDDDFWERKVVLCYQNGGCDWSVIYIPGHHHASGDHTVVRDSVYCSLKDVLLSRARYCRKIFLEKQLEPILIQISDKYINDAEFAKEIISIYPFFFRQFNSEIRKNPEMIEICLKAFNEIDYKFDSPSYSGLETVGFMTETRMSVALRMHSINPMFRCIFSRKINERLNGMSIHEYVEKMALRKKLKKELPKKVVANIARKI
ncbi:hypothetical protein KPA96_13760 [Burkholderia cenocepacia]|uniref:hypothetical protein n=1 Tax=Burkholderia cenocepacia TaxID=95486 RepID=UPI002864CF38|nr:hypothetical protein [Burkholderia cenocepacia]MDR8076723.1 hypothetical protein [Burkholderia cenocepacia]